MLNSNSPQYGHVPLALTNKGYKLSKQNKAQAIDNNNPQSALVCALEFLGQKPPVDLIYENVSIVVDWATKHWLRENVSQVKEINIEQ
jgi:glutamyl-Q tRNA(Asp) synthetase